VPLWFIFEPGGELRRRPVRQVARPPGQLAALEPHVEKLSETSRERLRLNPMRILDSKNERDQELIRNMKRPIDFLGTGAAEHFAAVRRFLDAWDVPYEIDPAIVRGLDYYRRTAFEVHHGEIGAQSALGGGGRYDGLIENLGGPATPGVGWAFGIERILDALAEEGVDVEARAGLELFLVPMDEDAIAEVAATTHRLRHDGVAAAHAYVRRNPGKGLRDADRAGAMFAALRGSAEREAGTYQVKHLATGEQTEVATDELRDFVRASRHDNSSESDAPDGQERSR
jgi:histidyl-tRNA synthetase